jgi:hypothetical protein
MTDAGVMALLEHWHGLAHRDPARIGLLPARSDLAGATEDAASRLLAVAQLAEFEERSGWQIDAGDAPGGAQAGERLALSSDLLVLVATQGTKVAHVRQAVRLLEQFGAPPRWALLMPRPGRWTRKRPARHAGPGAGSDRVLSAVRSGRGDR